MKFGAFQESYPIRTRNATPVRIWRRKGLLVNGALVVILAVAGGVTYLVIQPSSTSSALQTTAVQKGTVLATVSSSATLEAAKDLGLNFTTGGKVTNIYVTVGQRVEAGQLLARVDPTSNEQALTQAEAQLSSAEAQLSAAEEGETPTAKKVGSDQAASSLQSVTTAKSTLSAAQQALTDDEASEADSVTTAEDTLTTAEQTLSEDEEKVTSAESTLSQAEGQLSSDEAAEESACAGTTDAISATSTASTASPSPSPSPGSGSGSSPSPSPSLSSGSRSSSTSSPSSSSTSITSSACTTDD